VATSNGASTLHLAKHSFNFAYAVCERRFAVCYAQAKFHIDRVLRHNLKVNKMIYGSITFVV